MAWNRASEAPKVAPKKPSAMRGVVAGLVTVCALGGLCLWMFSGGDDAPKAKTAKERGRIKEVTPAKAPTNAVHEVKKAEPPKRPANWDQMSKIERAEWMRENRPPVRKTYTMQSISPKRPPVKPMFNHSVHTELAGYALPGRDVPPPWRFTDAQAREAIDTPIDYKFDDPMDVLEKKKAVEGMLIELKEYLDNGKHATDYFNDLAFRQSLEAETVRTVRNEVFGLMREGKYEDAKEALDIYNQHLQNNNIPPLRIKGLK